MTDITADVGDKKQVKARRQAAKWRGKLVTQGIKDCLSTRQGRAWIWEMLSLTGMFHSVGPAGVEAANYQNGRADFGRLLLEKVLQVDASAYILMHAEAGEPTANRQTEDVDGEQ